MTKSKTSAKSSKPTQVNDSFSDPLLDCLVILSQINERPLTGDAIRAGLPLVDNRLTPKLFVRAAKRAGFAARIMQRQLRRISPLTLPAVLILKDNQACLLMKLRENGEAEVISPESGGGSTTISLDKLEAEYTGFVIFTKPAYQFDRRTESATVHQTKNWFWETLWQYRTIYAQVILSALLINLFALATPLFIMNVYDRVIPNHAIETLWVLALGITTIVGFDFLLRTLRGYMIDLCGKKADTLIASRLFQQVMGIRLSHRPASAGAFANNLREFEVLRDFFTSASITAVVDLPFVFLFVWIISILAGPIAWIPFIAIPLVFCTALGLEIPIRRSVENAMRGATQKHAILVEALNGIEAVKSLSAEGVMQRKWEQSVGASAHAALKSRFFSSAAINITAVIQQAVTITVVVTGVYLIANGHLTVGGLIASTILSGRALAPLAQIAGILTRFHQSRAALRNLNQVMALPVERPANHHFLHRPSFQGKIEFRDVSFAYPEQPISAITNVSFTVQPGERVAIIGRTGSGKTTLEKLLLGLYEPTHGSIRIDDIDSSQLDPADLRRSIGYVSQECPLFYGSVRDNIAMGAPWTTDAAILRAAQLAGVDRFVRQHPAGYNMMIGENGAGLSGGQRQAIAIARALLPNPAILLLDEPTSAIDTATEQELLRNLMAHAQHKTIILVTHKASMLSLVNKLVVMDNGKIITSGPKEKVLAALKGSQEANQRTDNAGEPAYESAPNE